MVVTKRPASSALRGQCVGGGVFPGREQRRRHYRSISLRRTRWLHGVWLVLPGEMQGQSYAAALPRLPFVGSTSKSRLHVVLPLQTIFLRRTVLAGITWCCVHDVDDAHLGVRAVYGGQIHLCSTFNLQQQY